MDSSMDIGMFAFFPVTLSIYGVYSLSYGPAYLLDLVGPERRSVRKMDKLLRGISSKTGDKSFN
jgi:hypothetical protein